MAERGKSRVRSKAIETARLVDGLVVRNKKLLRAVTAGGTSVDICKFAGLPPSVSLPVGGITAGYVYIINTVYDFVKGNDPPSNG